MKAAVLHQLGRIPVFETFPDPVPQLPGQQLIQVKAASLKNLDKIRASGNHYASYTQLPVVMGFDGVGTLDDGTRVYAQGLTGMMAEKALIDMARYTVLPPALDDALAAALPNAVMGAALPLRFRANIQPGNVVVINGATGVTGQMAVQLARYYGASTIVVTGRNQESLDKLTHLGADVLVSLKQNDAAIIEQLAAIHRQTPIDVVIDYLWGHPVDLVMQALLSVKQHSAHRVQVVTVGSMAGETIPLASGALRSSAIELVGSGLGTFPPSVLRQFTSEVLPEMFQLAAAGRLRLDTVVAPLSDIEIAWQQEVHPGKRLVINVGY